MFGGVGPKDWRSGQTEVALLVLLTNGNGLFPHDQDETTVVAGDPVVTIRCINHQGTGSIRLMLVALRPRQHQDMFIASVVVMGDLSTGRVSQ